ncbi:MAG TPA: hypothetical protein VFT74_14140 [Isosphaeraceae bacterium]|nr:hypothetical protein [Isosphaeraceae bacterium]
MSLRNRGPAPERPTGSEIDPRSNEELAASVRRKLFFLLIALAAVPTSIGLSLVANRARDNIMIGLLPEGVTIETPVSGENGPTVRDAMANVGAYPTEAKVIVDYEGRPILFRRDGKDLPYEAGATPDPEGDGENPLTRPRIVEVD